MSPAAAITGSAAWAAGGRTRRNRKKRALLSFTVLILDQGARYTISSMAPKTGLKAEIRDLYRMPPEEFTAARNALASRLGKEKRKDDAAEVKALPKPTPSAW